MAYKKMWLSRSQRDDSYLVMNNDDGWMSRNNENKSTNLKIHDGQDSADIFLPWNKKNHANSMRTLQILKQVIAEIEQFANEDKSEDEHSM